MEAVAYFKLSNGYKMQVQVFTLELLSYFYNNTLLSRKRSDELGDWD